jgi:hypothetical protein
LSRSLIAKEFPRLKGTGFFVTSPETPQYNCIAWAAGDDSRWWWPIASPAVFWPANIPRREQLDAFVAAFATLGYVPCDDGELEKGFEKVALFADRNGKPTHAARQTENGSWTSKLGPHEDIRHNTISGLVGATYGDVVQFLKRGTAPN